MTRPPLRRFPGTDPLDRAETWTVRAEDAALLAGWVDGLLSAVDAEPGCDLRVRLRGPRDACRYALETAGLLDRAEPVHSGGHRTALHGRDVETSVGSVDRRSAVDLVGAWTAGVDLWICSGSPERFSLRRHTATDVIVRVDPDAAAPMTVVHEVPIAEPVEAAASDTPRPERRAMSRCRWLGTAGVLGAVVIALTIGALWVRHRTSPVVVEVDAVPVPSGAAIAADPLTGGFLMVGCCDASPPGSPALSSTWRWDGTTWTHLRPASAPAFSRNMVVGYDGLGGTFVLHGGDTTAQTWTWDRAAGTWRLEHDSLQPPAEPAVVLTRPGTNPQLLLITGGGDGAHLQTWSRRRDGWRVVDSSGPPGFVPYAVAYDGARAALVLVSEPGGTAQTYVFDFHAWTPVASTLPGDPNAQLAWDGSSGRVLALLPGDSFYPARGSDERAETWAWDGSAWSQVEAGGEPAGRGRLLVSPAGTVVFLGDGLAGGRPPVMRWDQTGWVARAPGQPVDLRGTGTAR